MIKNLIKDALHIGTPNPECACCGKPFTDDAQRFGNVLFRPISGVEFYCMYSICRDCTKTGQASKKNTERLKKKVLAYHFGDWQPEAGK